MTVATVERFKRGFFDRPAVAAAVDKATARVLSRFGAYVRTRARTSLRRRKAASAPGSPPSVHSKSTFATLKNILFAYEPAARTVVIGPVLVNGRPRGFRRGGLTVPELHEYGGTVPGDGRVITRKRKPGRDARGKFVSGGVERIKLTGDLRYPARPFMRPAYEHELGGRLREQLRDCVRAA